jgi:hypothetical protein
MQQVRETLDDLQQSLQVQLSQQQAASAAAPSDNAPIGSKAAAATSSANSTDGCNRSSAKPMVPQLLAALQQFWISRLSEQQQALLQPGATTQQPSSLRGRQHLQPPPPPPPKHFQDISTHAAAAAWVDLLRVTATASVQDESMAFAGDFTRCENVCQTHYFAYDAARWFPPDVASDSLAICGCGDNPAPSHGLIGNCVL